MSNCIELSAVPESAHQQLLAMLSAGVLDHDEFAEANLALGRHFAKHAVGRNTPEDKENTPPLFQQRGI